MNDGETVVSTLRALGVECTLHAVVEASQIVRYELKPGERTKMMDFTRLRRADDLAAALEAESVSIQAPIPGRGVVAIEVSRKDRQIIDQRTLPAAEAPLTVPIGLSVDGEPISLDLAQAPHTLIAGQTGSGKSSALRVILAGLLEQLGPEQMKLCLIDPKRVELSTLEGLPHLLFPVADDTRKAIMQLHALALNMDERYILLQRLGARDIGEANEKLTEMDCTPLPYFVIVVDELAELMVTSKGEVETVLARIAQKGRSAGLHLVIATQYPVASVLTGILRVNIPTKICFRVPDMTASRVVIDRNGGERLLGKGDGLYSFGGLPPKRFQSAFCSTERMAEIVERWTTTRERIYA